MTRPLTFTLLAALSCGCRCNDSGVGGVEAGFRVDVASVDFGRALEGTQVERHVTLFTTGRAALTVDAEADLPFRVNSSVELPGGSQVDLAVTFTAADGKSDGTLRLVGSGSGVSVGLTGEGVRPLDCRPSAQCRRAQFDLSSNACVEEVSADGDPCTPVSDCLENGQCRSGECLGSPRSCDDKNRCTDDACAEGLGCVHTATACPLPTHACRVPTCDPESGCGEALSADGTPCGSMDCVTAYLCLVGECRQVDTPEGFVCLPRTACQGEGHCTAHRCERPDPTDLAPEWQAPLDDGPALPGALVAFEGNLYFEVCDGGCQLVSYTGSGFQRFATPLDGGDSPSLVGVSPAGVVLLGVEGLRAFAASTGTATWLAPFAQVQAPPEAVGANAVCARDRVALGPAGEVIAAVSWVPARGDGGSIPDGGAGSDAGEGADGGPGGDGGPDAGGGADGGPGGDAGPDAGGTWDGGPGGDDGADGGGGADGGPDGDGGADAGGGSDGGGGLGADAGGPSDAGPGPVPGLQTLFRLEADGGLTAVETVRSMGTASRLALGAGGEVVLYEPSGAAARATPADGGYSVDSWGTFPGADAVAVASGRMVLGAAHLIDSDGGVEVRAQALGPDGGETPTRPMGALMAAGVGYAFSRGCAPAVGPSCTADVEGTFLNAFGLANGQPAWDARVLPDGVWGRLDEAAVVSGGAVVTLTEVELDAGRLAHLQLFTPAGRPVVCPLARDAVLGPAVFERGHLYVLVNRSGAWTLEAYELAGLPLETSGWPQRDGLSGARREE